MVGFGESEGVISQIEMVLLQRAALQFTQQPSSWLPRVHTAQIEANSGACQRSASNFHGCGCP